MRDILSVRLSLDLSFSLTLAWYLAAPDSVPHIIIIMYCIYRGWWMEGRL